MPPHSSDYRIKLRPIRFLESIYWFPTHQLLSIAKTLATTPRVTPPDPRPEGRGPRLFFDFLGRELTFFRNSLQGEGREWEKETPCGKGLGSWDT